MTYDVTVYVPGVESLTLRDLDQKTVNEVKLQAPAEAKVTVCDHVSRGNGRYR